MEDVDVIEVAEVGAPAFEPMAVLLLEECYSVERQDYCAVVSLLPLREKGGVLKVEPACEGVWNAFFDAQYYFS